MNIRFPARNNSTRNDGAPPMGTKVAPVMNPVCPADSVCDSLTPKLAELALKIASDHGVVDPPPPELPCGAMTTAQRLGFSGSNRVSDGPTVIFNSFLHVA